MQALPPRSFRWIAPVLVGAACLGVIVVACGVPPSAMSALGSPPALLDGLWHLWYAAGPMWTEGLQTTLLRFPVGERVWPEAWWAGPIFAPWITHLGVIASWNLLHALQILIGGIGAALLMRRLGVHVAWGALIALSPALLQSIETGHIEASAMAWMPWAVWALMGDTRAIIRGFAAGLAMTTAPATAVCTLLAIAVIAPRRLRSPAAGIAIVLTGISWGFQAGVYGTPAATAQLHGGGDLWGFIGMGPGPVWGGPLLLATLLALAPGSGPLARRGVGLVGIGTLIALGTNLRVGSDIELALPLALIADFPPVAQCTDLARFGVLAWLGLALILGERAGTRPWPLLLLLGLSVAPFPGWTTLPVPRFTEAKGPVLTYPLERHAHWSLLAQTAHGQPTSAGLREVGPQSYVDRVTSNAWHLSDLQEWAIQSGFRHIVVDDTRDIGNAASIALALGGTVRDVAGSWPTRQWRGHDAVRHHHPILAPTTPPDPQPADWNWRHPELTFAMDVERSDRAVVQIWAYVSDDFQTWTRLPGPIAHSITSLGLNLVDEDALMVSGLIPWTSLRSFGITDEPLGIPSLVALTTTDLVNWGIRRFTLDAGTMIVDPQIRWAQGRPELIAWLMDTFIAVDPVLYPGPHRVIRAPMDDDRRFRVAQTLWSGPRIADPVLVDDRLYATQLTLHPTTGSAVIVATDDGDGFKPVSSIDGISVPHVFRDGAKWRMLAQFRGMQVVQLDSPDGIEWSEPRPVSGLEVNGPCESPVAERFAGRYVLFCSERVVPRDRER